MGQPHAAGGAGQPAGQPAAQRSERGTARRSPRRTERGDRTRAALVDAALVLFDRQGVERTSVDEITAAAAVAKGTFYVHFQRKADVLLELAARLVAEVADGPPLPVEPVAALTELGSRAAVVLSRPPRWLLGRMIREVVGHREDWMRVLGQRRALGAVILPIIQRGQDVGALRDDQSPARLAQALTILWLDGVIGWSERADRRDLDVDLARATALFLDGAVRR